MNYSLKTPFLLERIYYKMKENILVYSNSITRTCTLRPALCPALHCACAVKIMNYPMKTPCFLERMYYKMKENILIYNISLIGTCTLLPALCPALHCACADKIMNYSLKTPFLLERIYYKMKENTSSQENMAFSLGNS